MMTHEFMPSPADAVAVFEAGNVQLLPEQLSRAQDEIERLKAEVGAILLLASLGLMDLDHAEARLAETDRRRRALVTRCAATMQALRTPTGVAQ
jgi:hypothetical protein